MAKGRAFALVDYYVKQYENHYGTKPYVNRYKGRWGFESVLEDMPLDEAKALIDYYFETVSTNGHNLEWFFYSYDKLFKAKQERDKDAAELAVIRENTRRATEEWRKKKRANN